MPNTTQIEYCDVYVNDTVELSMCSIGYSRNNQNLIGSTRNGRTIRPNQFA